MINIRLSKVLGILAMLVSAAVPAYTAEQAASLDPATNREFSAKLLMCGQCHGLNGTPVRPGFPIIWGQQEPYLLKQLQDFRNKSRDVELMTWAAITLHDQQEMAAAASYFAKKEWPARPAQAAKAAAATAPRGMAVCQACHQADFRGAPQAEGAPAPRLAGQSYEYLVETMRAYAAGERKNNETMAQLMAGIMPADREAMARYLSGL
jgi:cytochrome c553